MKQGLFKVLMLATVAVVTSMGFQSCIRDNVDDLLCPPADAPYVEGVRTSLMLNPILDKHQTRANPYDNHYGGDLFETGEGALRDRYISTFRILIYNSAGNLAKVGTNFCNYLVSSPTVETPPYKFEIDTGSNYTFVFIANEHTLSTTLSDNTKVATLTSLNTLLLTIDTDIAASTSRTSPAQRFDIPMVRVIPQVTVKGANLIKIGTGGDQNGIWTVDMERAAIRISMHIKMSENRFFDWDNYRANVNTKPIIYINNIRTQSHLMRLSPYTPKTSPLFKNDNSPMAVPFEARVEAESQGSWGAYTNAITPGMGTVDIYVDRLILPELVFSDIDNPANKDTALELSMIFHEKDGNIVELSAPIHRPNPETAGVGYDLPRNTWLMVEAEVNDDLNLVTKVLPWGDAGLDDTELLQYNLTTDKDLLVFSAEKDSEVVEVFSDYPSSDRWTLYKPAPGEDPDYTFPAGIDVSPENGAAGDKVDMTVVGYKGTTFKKDSIYLVAGNIKKKITIVRVPDGSNIVSDDPAPANVIPYVGAFWKAHQFGERLIRIPRPTVVQTAIDGDWAAVVLEGGDWIALDTKPSTDAGVWTDSPSQSGNDDGFDAAHRVASVETVVTGKVTPTTPDGIYFRIGLNGRYTPTKEAPARYGVVLLVYTSAGTTKMQRIWVRQGEDPDYLMYPDDNSGNGVLASRPLARKFSPYNLTAAEFMNNGGVTASVQKVDVRPGGAPSVAVPADYPSQFGAQFYYASYNTAGVYAFNPIGLAGNIYTNGLPSTAWLTDDSESVHPIGTVRDNHESCPAGYRRPSEGDDTVFLPSVSIDQSEVFQSLFYSPVGGTSNIGSIDNSSVGHYADGFYDRRKIKKLPTPVSIYLIDIVAVDRSTIAVGGRVFYNPEHNNSLFFPFSGRMNNSATTNILVGETGLYHTSSSSGNKNPWVYEFSKTENKRNSSQGSEYRFAIRCVVAPTMTVSPSMLTFSDSESGSTAQKSFEVKLSGTNADWTYSVTGAASNFTFVKEADALIVYPATDNTATAARTASVTISATGLPSQVVTVTQGGAPVLGVRNIGTAEGVIGYIHRPGHPDHHKLTMVKDDDGDDTNGIVYVANFKFGSLVATSSENYGVFTSDDVVAWPSEWKSTTDNRAALKAAVTGSGQTAWDKVPGVSFSGADITNYGRELMDHPTVTDNAAKGDPCIYWAAKNGWGNGWRLPTAKENVAFVGRTADASWDNSGSINFSPSLFPGLWTDGTAPLTTTPGMGHFPVQNGGGRTAFSESIPAGGWRMTNGTIGDQGQSGRYWSSTASSTANSYYFLFYNAAVNPVYSVNYANGHNVRCVQASSLKVTPTTLTFNDDQYGVSGAKSVQVEYVGGNGGWSATPSSTDFECVPIDSETLSIRPTSANTGIADRTATITISANGVPDVTVTVVQRSDAWSTLLAPPGVIGYKSSTHELTIRGSVEYTGSPVVGPDGNALATGEPLEDETVYVALFKYGSLFAIASEPLGSTFEMATDLIARPAEYTGSFNTYLTIPFVDNLCFTKGKELMTDGVASGEVADAKGTGDPCIYWGAKKGWGSGWHTPSMGTTPYSWHKAGGSPFGTMDHDIDEESEVKLVTSPIRGLVGHKNGVTDWSMFLSFPGYRGADGKMYSQGTSGQYMTTTTYGLGFAYILGMDSNRVVPLSHHGNRVYPTPVRCVR